VDFSLYPHIFWDRTFEFFAEAQRSFAEEQRLRSSLMQVGFYHGKVVDESSKNAGFEAKIGISPSVGIYEEVECQHDNLAFQHKQFGLLSIKHWEVTIKDEISTTLNQ